MAHAEVGKFRGHGVYAGEYAANADAGHDAPDREGQQPFGGSHHRHADGHTEQAD